MAYLSREDLDNFAERILRDFVKAEYATGKGKQFALACAASILLLVAGCIVAVIIDNYFLIPVLAVAFAFWSSKKTQIYSENTKK